MSTREVLEVRQGGGPRWLLLWLWVGSLRLILVAADGLVSLAFGLLPVRDREIWATTLGALTGSLELLSRARSIARSCRLVTLNPARGTVQCWAHDRNECLWDYTYTLNSIHEVAIEQCSREGWKRLGTCIRLVGPSLTLDRYELKAFVPVLLNDRIQFPATARSRRWFASRIADFGHLAIRDETQRGQMAARSATW